MNGYFLTVKRLACTALLAVAMVTASLGTSAAARPGPEHICKKPVHAHAYTYGVQGYGVRCPFMREWATAWLRDGKTIPHWQCTGDRFYEGGTCHKLHVDPPKPYFEIYIFD